MEAKILRLTENTLARIIKESVKQIIKEYYNDTNKTKEEIIPNLFMTSLDANDDIASMLFYKEEEFDGVFGSVEELTDDLDTHNIDYSMSIKLIDKSDGEIYGLLLMSECDIDKGTYGSVREYLGDNCIDKLRQLSGCEGYAFMIDKRLRGTHVYRQMLNYMFNAISNNYDYVYCAVAKNLRSHNLYLRLGFEICGIDEDETKYYILPLSKQAKNILEDARRLTQVGEGAALLMR